MASWLCFHHHWETMRAVQMFEHAAGESAAAGHPQVVLEAVGDMIE